MFIVIDKENNYKAWGLFEYYSQAEEFADDNFSDYTILRVNRPR